MTTFAKATFDVAGYLACRPSYPSRVYDVIYAFHARNGGQFDQAVDLGCGPGFVALSLASRFDKVTALDPAAKMVSVGLQPESGKQEIQYKVGTAEDLIGAGVGEGTVDLVAAGQAAHWFEYPKVWRQLTRVVRPGGTVAFIGYAEMVLPNHPSLNRLISHHSATTLGKYWQPGRAIVEGLLDRVPFPVKPTPTASELPADSPKPDLIEEPKLQHLEDNFDFSSWDPSSAVRIKSDDEGGKWLMTKTFTWATLEGYLRTWSALHAYHEAHPEDSAKKGKGPVNGDVIDRLVGQIREEVKVEGPRGEEKEGEIVGGWPLVVMMIKKKT